MDYEIVWTEQATSDLEEITTYIAQTESAGRHRFVVSGKYRVFYRVREDEERVEILTVRHHARQDPDLPD